MSEIIQVGEHENGQGIELRLHEVFRVTLPETRTAGFRWSLRTPVQGVCSLLQEDFEASTTGLGAAGTHHWELRAEQAGSGEIVIEYARPWERANSPARSFSVSVH